MFTAKRIKAKGKKDWGLVGDIQEADVSLLDHLTEKGYIPVISSVGLGLEGETLNMNADHVAEEIAWAIKAQKLIYLTDVQGVIMDDQLVNFLTLPEAKKLLKHPQIKGGMLPKLTSAVESLLGGVEQVHIINGGIEHAVLLEIFTDVGIGTMISRQ